MILPARELMPLIHAALKRGQHVRMTVNGSSMMPFLHDSDTVELKPARQLRLGDMVLVQSEERYVLHRIISINGASFFIRGDAQSWSEGPFTKENVLGRVTTAWRKDCKRIFERGFWRLAGLLWLHTNPLGFYLYRGTLTLRRFQRGAYRRFQRIWKQNL
ncbi:MAG: S26 family signal peptidase [Candidatus Electrothrix scaldis]|nr:MAG: S26 family signal peptidase [Candidatus Electrothrix sp. GW3-3]